MSYPKRLIEVDLPIKRISEHARREKSIRHGHISTLHIWWARRPLAACRAVICAALWPDPADKLCPQSFRDDAVRIITEFAKAAVKEADADQRRRSLCSECSWGHWVNLYNQEIALTSTNFNHLNSLRHLLLDFIADFSNWDNSNEPLYLEASRKLTQSAHEALGGAPGTRPLVVDPFAGGGSIPLEALRVGADVFASDLNPVAVLLNKVVLEYIPKYGKRLAEEVRRWGQWIKEQAEKELAEFYPKDPDGATPIAYIWARTIQCEGPGCGAEIPLIRSLWLAKKGNRSVSLQIEIDYKSKSIDFVIIQKHGRDWLYQNNPKQKTINPKMDGTVKRGSATCPICGYTTPVASVRKQLKKRNGGAMDARLICVVVARKNEQGRFYRLPTCDDILAIEKAQTSLSECIKNNRKTYCLVPDETLPVMSGVFNAPIYGHTTWGSLFNCRQQLSMVTILNIISGFKKNPIDNDDLKKSIQLCLALALDRLADKNASLTVWNTVGEKIEHVFGRQALPMTWDFPEVGIFSSSTGNWMSHIDLVSKVLENQNVFDHIGNVVMGSALNHVLPSDSAHVLFTDPPYYNAVPYADLSDFFYVWLKRSVKDLYPDIFLAELSPKDDECCEMAGWDSVRYPHKDGKWYESKMYQAMLEGRRVLTPKGISVVVFAHKSTQGWETQIQAMIDAGWVFTGSWPIDTERPARLRAQKSAALASSVHLVCRPRENSDGSLRTEEVGDWRDVLQALPKRIHEWMPRLAAEGVVGADAIFACLGPALEIFSCYSRVEKASGEQVTLKEYLEQVWAAVAKEALKMIFSGADATGFEEDARLTAMWLWTLSTGNGKTKPDDESEEIEDDIDEEEEGTSKKVKMTGFILEYDAARKIGQGLGAHLEQLNHLVQVKGDKARLLPVAERVDYLMGAKKTTVSTTSKKSKKKNDDALFDYYDTPLLDEDSNFIPDAQVSSGKTVLDRIHQSMLLFASGRGEALKRFLVTDGVGRDERFWRLAQALSALYPAGSNEKRWVDGVMARKKGLGF